MANNSTENPATGLFLVYEPRIGTPIVDIVLVHGLEGHPYRTWASKPSKRKPDPSNDGTPQAKRLRSDLHRSSHADISASQSDTRVENGDTFAPVAYWPEFLPSVCPKARILSWGYGTKDNNHNNPSSHSKDLLFALQRHRPAGRPLLFIAHSLGGVLIKEMLMRSHLSLHNEFLNIVTSTSGLIFLGTPHRGSKDLANVGGMVGRIASAIMMETNSAVLDARGLETSDLERCQESFSCLWKLYNFTVKTFQEGLPVTGIRTGTLDQNVTGIRTDMHLLDQKVVPEYSSKLGDHKERADTILACHMDMCRFRSSSDAGYRKIRHEVKQVYHFLDMRSEQWKEHTDLVASLLKPGETPGPPGYEFRTKKVYARQEIDDYLKILSFPELETRKRLINEPFDQTCLWILQNPEYQAWWNRQDLQSHNGLLWIKGKHGSGKSTLIKSLLSRIEQDGHRNNVSTASFFFNAADSELEGSALGLFRSLLYQLLPHFNTAFDAFKAYADRLKGTKGMTSNDGWEHAKVLKGFLHYMFSSMQDLEKRRTILFIDGLDECRGEIGMPGLVRFFRKLTSAAYQRGIQLDVLLSSRQVPTVNIELCPNIIVQDFNKSDMAEYMGAKFATAGISDEDSADMTQSILERASGAFSCVVHEVETILKERDNGKDTTQLQSRIDDSPVL